MVSSQYFSYRHEREKKQACKICFLSEVILRPYLRGENVKFGLDISDFLIVSGNLAAVVTSGG